MKLFKDIEFNPHAHGGNTIRGVLDLGGGLELSVVQGDHLYGDAGTDTFELALFKDDDFVPMSVYDDVLGWLSPNDIDVILIEIQKDSQKFLEKKQEEKEKYREELLKD
jgi:hypothetical protein